MANGLASSVATQEAIYSAVQGGGSAGASIEEILRLSKKSRATVGPVLKWLMAEGSVELVVRRDGSRVYRRVGLFPLGDAAKLEQYEEERRRVRELIESGGSAVQILKQIKEVLG
jgi:DNA-binding transcriptional ArsR family regulator